MLYAHCRLFRGKLTVAKLFHSDVVLADLSYANLTGEYLQGVNLFRATLFGTDFRRYHLNYAV